jgi:hypothetical protein
VRHGICRLPTWSEALLARHPCRSEMARILNSALASRELPNACGGAKVHPTCLLADRGERDQPLRLRLPRPGNGAWQVRFAVPTVWRRELLRDHRFRDGHDRRVGVGDGLLPVATRQVGRWYRIGQPALEVVPGEYPEAVRNVHTVLICGTGKTLGNVLNFDELVAGRDVDGVEVFRCAPALKFTGVGRFANERSNRELGPRYDATKGAAWRKPQEATLCGSTCFAGSRWR